MRTIIALAAAALLIGGCSSKGKETQTTSAATGAQDIAITAAFTPDPPRKGVDILTLTLKDATGAPVKGASVRIDTTMPSMSMSGPTFTAKDNKDGTYTAQLALQYATTWRFAISAGAASGKGATQFTATIK
ncbi:MAG: FixH family protein [Candidatus Tyrphobacter sp.]